MLFISIFFYCENQEHYFHKIIQKVQHVIKTFCLLMSFILKMPKEIFTAYPSSAEKEVSRVKANVKLFSA